eukprot:6264300-Amphidinium_carterae.1
MEENKQQPLARELKHLLSQTVAPHMFISSFLVNFSATEATRVRSTSNDRCATSNDTASIIERRHKT